MKNKCLTVKRAMMLFFAASLPFMNYGQTPNLKYEILVYIQPDSLELPPQQKGYIGMEKATIKSKRLHQHFSKLKPVAIAKAFADWNEKDSIKTREDGVKVKAPSFSRIFSLKFASEQAVDSAIAVLVTAPGVLFAEKHAKIKPFADPKYDDGTQWHLRNDGRNSGVVGADIHASDAWSIYTGSTSITIGIIDSGVELTHDEMAGKATGDGPMGEGHGTHVAGIAAGNANNGIGGRGVDWNARILSKRIFDATTYDNPTGYIGDNNTATKITDAVNSGAQILNNSWGGPDYSSTIAMAFAYAFKMNRTSVVSMGNTYDATTQYPAGLNNVIAVGATQNNDSHSTFSSTGPHIDVSAPGGINGYPNTNGKDIYSSYLNNGYQFIAGTSQAAPQVTGLASLLKGYNANLTNDDIENIIKLSADKVGNDPYSNGFNNNMGFGRINARKALDYLRSPYSLYKWSVTGGTDIATVGSYQMLVYGASGLADGVYVVKRHEVRKTVTFPQSFCQLIGSWGRGVNSTGWSVANPNYGSGFCDVVPGTISNNGATLRTYVYEVTNISGQTLGWYPTTAANVVFAYSALGVPGPNLSLSGNDYVCPQGTPGGSFSVANLPAGSTVTWSVSPSGAASINSSGVVTSNGYGPATAYAVVSYSCISTITTTLSKNFWMGFPPVSVISGPSSICPNSGGVFTAAPPSSSGYSYYGFTSTYGWSYSPLTLSSGSTSSSNPISLLAPSNFTGTSVVVFAFNACGTAPSPAVYGVGKSNTCPNSLVAASYVVSPNPATTSVSITKASATTQSIATDSTVSTASVSSLANSDVSIATTETIKETPKVEIFDKYLVCRKTYLNQDISKPIDIRGLESGLYYLVITDSQHTERHQLVVQ